MKVAIAGAGNVGTFIAADLYEAGHTVLVIEEDVDLVAKLRPTLPVTWFVGDACEVKSLHEAGLAGTDVVVAATGDDEDNLVISLLAKQEFAVPRVVARVNHPKNHWLFNQAWGVDAPVSTPHLLTALVEVTLADESPAAGRTVADLAVPRDATLVAVVRDGHVVVPRGDTVLQIGDEVLALVTPDSEGKVKELLIGV